ncbi:hypothetical protein K5A80_36445 [Pseudomonas aeruginosa]|nr:DUF6631 family protein [Pseudomonas aeruginosa]UIO45581.1 hypothetical protein K5A80_36445 [Pseudomonas aeruginosa]
MTVRELSFSEQLRHNHLLAPLGDSLAAIPAEDGQPGRSTSSSTPWPCTLTLRELIAISCGQSMDWVDALPPDEGEALVLTWWEVNNGFSFDGSGVRASWKWH